MAGSPETGMSYISDQNIRNGERSKAKDAGMQGDYIDYVGRQVLLVDPRYQGFGLSEYGFLDGYANKFFILSGTNGIFITPRAIPVELLVYYDQLGIDTALPSHIISPQKRTEGQTLAERAAADPSLAPLLAGRSNARIVPYMVTPEVEQFAGERGMQTLTDATVVERLGDKADFQDELALINANIARETGFDVAIQHQRFQAGDIAAGEAAYNDLSSSGTRDVVVVKPKSASALGVFVGRAERGKTGVNRIIGEHFAPDEEVLLEEFVQHNHSPSMQGARTPQRQYNHLYYGRQIISFRDERVDYDMSQIPFGPQTVRVSNKDLGRLQAVHEALGDLLITPNQYAGVGGFDLVTQINQRGQIQHAKITEMNVHLPSSLAVFAAIRKVFPDGFAGVAQNMNIPLRPGQTTNDFMREHHDVLLARKNNYGMFPLNVSYPDKVDVVFFGRDAEHVQNLAGGFAS